MAMAHIIKTIFILLLLTPSASYAAHQNGRHAELVALVNTINNHYNNTYSYAYDKNTYNTSDFWATPEEFKANMKGDCEDFAIAKFFELKKFGFQDVKLLIVTTQRNTKHMVASVTIDNTVYILDNARDHISYLEERKDLRFEIAFNETDVWAGHGHNSTNTIPMRLKKFQRVLKAQ